MSQYYKSFIITTHELDLGLISKMFESSCMDYYLPNCFYVGINNTAVYAELLYQGTLSVNDECSEMFSYCFYTDRSIHELNVTYSDNTAFYPDAMSGLRIMEHLISRAFEYEPFDSDLRVLFDYILSLNSHFYILFSDMYAELEITDGKLFFEMLMSKMEIKKYHTEEALDVLVNGTHEIFEIDPVDTPWQGVAVRQETIKSRDDYYTSLPNYEIFGEVYAANPEAVEVSKEANRAYMAMSEAERNSGMLFIHGTMYQIEA